MKAYLKNYRQSPRKVRLVSEFVKGKSVSKARNELKFLNKKASGVITKLLNSAVANAKENNSKNEEDLFVKEVRVDGGPTLKRIRPRARGSAYQIKKRTSKISLELGQKVPAKSKTSKKKTTKKKSNLKSKA